MTTNTLKKISKSYQIIQRNLKNTGEIFTIKWSIIKLTQSYTPDGSRCNLAMKHDESNAKSKNMHKESSVYILSQSLAIFKQIQQISIIAWEAVSAVIVTPLRLVD